MTRNLRTNNKDVHVAPVVIPPMGPNPYGAALQAAGLWSASSRT